RADRAAGRQGCTGPRHRPRSSGAGNPAGAGRGRDEARKVAAEAREQAARLAGQLEALQRQQDKAEAAEKATKAPKGKGGE
ncbi:hypothetical protein, partial [Aeromonas hydrophila]|uniref:hypothetical protein n=1 Tax=Aeromonas hydrophila TaxID=644 RepID=UPI003EC7367D